MLSGVWGGAMGFAINITGKRGKDRYIYFRVYTS